MIRIALTTVFILMSFASVSRSAWPPPSDTETILIRQDCTGLGDNCTTSLATASSWTNGTRLPDVSSPLVWDFGPGEWSGYIDCDGVGYVTYRGRGIGVTRILGSGNSALAAFLADDCESVNVQDMTLYGQGDWTVDWREGGSSNWYNVEIINEADGAVLGRTVYSGNAFYDECQNNSGKAVHYFFSSKLLSRGQAQGLFGLPATVTVTCGEAWFYGSDIVREVAGDTISAYGAAAVTVTEYPNQPLDGDVKLFGSSIRVILDTIMDSGGITGVYASKQGTVHMHGGVINVGASPSGSVGSGPITFSGIIATDDAAVHTPDSAFNIRPLSGVSIKRLTVAGNASIASPFLWEAGATPPVSSTETNELTSTTGQDVFVEIDCDASGDCDPASNGGATEPHLMIYSAAHCGSTNPWFDTVAGACRQ